MEFSRLIPRRKFSSLIVLSFHDILIKSGEYYPFVIMNTGRAGKKGTHWWSFLDLHPKKENFRSDSLKIS